MNRDKFSPQRYGQDTNSEPYGNQYSDINIIN